MWVAAQPIVGGRRPHRAALTPPGDPMTNSPWPSRRPLPLVLPALLLAVVAGCQGHRAAADDDRVIARAAGHELTVGEASRLLASNQRVSADSQSVGVLADFWVDYTLLDSALSNDSTLGNADLGGIIASERDHALVMKLRDAAVHADTSFSDEEVAEQAKARGIRLDAEDGDSDEERRREGKGEEKGGEAARELRRALVATAQRDAEGAYLDSVSKAGEITLAEGGLELMRRVAARPALAAQPGTGAKPIARYRGGVLTASDFVAALRSQPFQFRGSVAASSPVELEEEVQRLVTNHLLLQEAKRRGVTLTPAEDAAIHARTRAAIDTSLARVRELNRRMDGAGDARVSLPATFAAAVAGRGELVPLGQLGVVVRGMYPSELLPQAFPLVAQRVRQLKERAPQE